jgi:hypothetical protein
VLKRHLFKRIIWIAVLVSWALPVLAEMIVDTAWVRRYDGPAGWYDFANAIATDGCSSVFVTGETHTSEADADCGTIRYRSSGDTSWIRRHDGYGGYADVGHAVVADSAGNAYVAGGSSVPGMGGNFLTMKYSAGGDTLWVRTYDGSEHHDEYAEAIAVDAAGNVYVTGGSFSYATSGDYLTLKYYTDGDTAWVRRYNGPGNSYDWARALAIDEGGNVYVTGRSRGDGTGYDIATIKYSSDGNQEWVARYNGLADSSDGAHGIALDASSNVYVTGYSHGGANGYDCVTIEYDPDGNEQWVALYDGPSSLDDWGLAIEVQEPDTIYVGGTSEGDGSSEDYILIKLDSGGDTVWVRRYDGPESLTDHVSDMELDNGGTVLLTGSSSRSQTCSDFLTVAYYPNGDTAWIRRYSGPGYSNDGAWAMAVDHLGDVYVTGSSDSTGTEDFDYVTIKYCQAQRGDANGDKVINVADIVCLVNFLYRSGDPPIPMQAGDANCDGIVDIADIVYLVNYLYRGGDPPGC